MDALSRPADRWPAGLLTPLLTPFGADGELDVGLVGPLVQRQVDAGAAAVVVAGGTGEHGALHLDERRRLAEAVAEALDGRLPMIVQTGALATRDAIALGDHADSCGAAGLMVASPFGEPIGWHERVRYYEEVDAAASLPIMIYNTPPAGILTLAQVEELLELPRVSAVKDSSGDPILFGDLLALSATEGGPAIYQGYDSLLVDAARNGARGALFGVANLIPDELIATLHMAQDGEEADLRASWPSLRVLLRLVEDCSNYIGLVKAGMALEGLDVGDVRAPYLMPGEGEREQLAERLATTRRAFAGLARAERGA